MGPRLPRLVRLDGSGNIRLVETKLARNRDDLLIFQGLDYCVWALAYEAALRRQLRAAKNARIVVHYVVGGSPPRDDVHVSTYAPAQAAALVVPWRFQLVSLWFASPTMCGAVIVMFRSRDLWKVNSKDHAVAASASKSGTISATALHHYRGLN